MEPEQRVSLLSPLFPLKMSDCLDAFIHTVLSNLLELGSRHGGEGVFSLMISHGRFRQHF